MQYPLTDIQAYFEITRMIRYLITAKKIISTDDRRTDGQAIGSFFEKRKTTKNTCFCAVQYVYDFL